MAAHVLAGVIWWQLWSWPRVSLPGWLVLVLVFAFPALEASAFIGFVFLGEIAVILGGVAASRGTVPLWAVIAAAVAGPLRHSDSYPFPFLLFLGLRCKSASVASGFMTMLRGAW